MSNRTISDLPLTDAVEVGFDRHGTLSRVSHTVERRTPGTLSDQDRRLADEWEKEIQANPGRPATIGELNLLMDTLIGLLKKQHDEICGLKADARAERNRSDALEATTKELAQSDVEIKSVLESLQTVRYRKVWDAATTYAPGSLVSYDGSIWHANVEARGVKPGDGRTWTLGVKRGRDGRDLR